jgi:ABC-type glycerol-3-phosphate transport system substrate-binding protein
MIHNIAQEIQEGHIASLSMFNDDPAWEVLNPTFRQMFTHFGRTFAVPYRVIPHGVYMNYDLADTHNLDVPSPNWNFSDYLEFGENSISGIYYSSPGIPNIIMDTMTRDIFYQLLFRETIEDPSSRHYGTQPFVTMDTYSVRRILQLIPIIAWHTVSTNGHHNPTADATFRNGRDNWALFATGSVLMNFDHAERMSIAASREHASAVQVDRWDYFPRPSTPWLGNSIGIEMSPLAIQNYAADTGILTPEQEMQKRLAWEFLRFLTMDLRAWTARSNFYFGPHDLSALDNTFPAVIGNLYRDIMDLHFLPAERAPFADVRDFPGYHHIITLWNEGHNWHLTQQAYPLVDASGREILHEWRNRWSATYAGAFETDTNWLPTVVSRLPLWDVMFNERFEQRFWELEQVMDRFYLTN